MTQRDEGDAAFPRTAGTAYDYSNDGMSLRGDDGRFAKPAVWESRLSCELCDDDQAELRIYPLQGWVPDQVVCQTCCTARDGEHDFTDFALAQGAAQ